MARPTIVARLLPIGEIDTPEIPAPVIGPATVNPPGTGNLFFKHLLAIRRQQLHAERGSVGRKKVACYHRALWPGQFISHLVDKYAKYRLAWSQVQQVELIEPN